MSPVLHPMFRIYCTLCINCCPIPAMTKSFLKFSCLILLLASCAREHEVASETLVLKADLDSKKASSLELQAADTSWFSNRTDFSISLWVKSGSADQDTTIIISNADFRTANMGLYGMRRNRKGITFYSFDGGWAWNMGNGELHYNYEPDAGMQPISDKLWHHLACTYKSSSNELRLFYDGRQVAILHVGDLHNKDFVSSSPLRIGGNQDLTPSYSGFRGSVDRLRVWSSSLSQEDIKAEYEQFSGKRISEPEMLDDQLTVVNWNIWHGGTHYTLAKDGFDGIERTIELIRESGADIVLMQETYGAGSEISSKLGFCYYEASSCIGAVWGANLSVMSRFPLKEAYLLEEPSNYGKNYAFNNAGVKVRLSVDKSVIVFSNWYNGRKPEDLAGALQAWEPLMDNASEVPVIFGGDYNSVSHLDDGVGESGHSRLMTEAGFTDVFRHLHPDVVSHPGHSFHTSPRRIDYIYFKGNKLEPTEFRPIVPDFRGKGELTPGYPSDHLGLVARFDFK